MRIVSSSPPRLWNRLAATRVPIGVVRATGKYVKIPWMRVGVKACVQYGLAKFLLGLYGGMPRGLAYRAGNAAAALGYHLARRQREAGLRNLRMALPELSKVEHNRILKEVFRNLGRLLVEFSHLPDLTPENISSLVEYEGGEHYLEAERRGKGTLFLTLHMGSWELSPVAHALYGHPLRFLTRPIDNPRVDGLITRLRTSPGNQVIRRTRASRDVLTALRNNEAVGFLIDQNTTRDRGVFVDFFGIPAATSPSVATFALRTGATVVPAFMRWDETRRRHILRFTPPVELLRTGSREHDIVENTRLFNEILEGFVREVPGQWLWIHKRWKTRPEGEPSLY